MKLRSHDEMFSMLPNRECDICNEGSEYQAYIEIVNKAQIACLDCSYKDGHLTDREYSEAQKLEAYYVDDWTEAERLRKAGEAEFLKRMKGPDYAIEEDED